jgi:hypothetical protein
MKVGMLINITGASDPDTGVVSSSGQLCREQI